MSNAIGNLYKLSLFFLMGTSWVSGFIFALFIFGMYLIPHSGFDLEAWNRNSLILYTPDRPIAMSGMLTHVFFGALLLMMGPIQFFDKFRSNFPNVHRWVGLFYVLASFMTGFGGLIYLSIMGSVGGSTMSVAFFIGGILVVVCSIQTIRYALLGNYVIHRQWATRLFAIMLASWMYRIEYAFIKVVLQDWGTGPLYSGPLDYFMDFASFLAPLIAAEIIIRAKKIHHTFFWKTLGSLVCLGTGSWICFATFALLMAEWGMPILNLFYYLF